MNKLECGAGTCSMVVEPQISHHLLVEMEAYFLQNYCLTTIITKAHYYKQILHKLIDLDTYIDSYT